MSLRLYPPGGSRLASLSPQPSSIGLLHPHSTPSHSYYPASCPSSPFNYNSTIGPSKTSSDHRSNSLQSPYWDTNGNKHQTSYDRLGMPGMTTLTENNNNNNPYKQSNLISNLDGSATFREGFILDAQPDVPDLLVSEDFLQKCIEEIQQNDSKFLFDVEDTNSFPSSFSQGPSNGISSYNINNNQTAGSQSTLQNLSSRQSNLMAASPLGSAYTPDNFQQRQADYHQQWRQHDQPQHTYPHLQPHKPTTLDIPGLGKTYFGNQNLSKTEMSRSMECLSAQLMKSEASPLTATMSPPLGRKGQAASMFQDFTGRKFLSPPNNNTAYSASADFEQPYQRLLSPSPSLSGRGAPSRSGSLQFSSAGTISPQLLSPVPPRIPLPHEVTSTVVLKPFIIVEIL